MESRPTEEQDFLAELGRRVRHVRALRGMSRKVLARVSGISERYIAQLESGKGNVSIKLLRRVSGAMGTRIEDLINDPTVPPDASGVATPDAPPEHFFGDLDLLAPYVARWSREELLRALADARVSAAPVLEPGQGVDDWFDRHPRDQERQRERLLGHPALDQDREGRRHRRHA